MRTHYLLSPSWYKLSLKDKRGTHQKNINIQSMKKILMKCGLKYEGMYNADNNALQCFHYFIISALQECTSSSCAQRYFAALYTLDHSLEVNLSIEQLIIIHSFFFFFYFFSKNYLFVNWMFWPESQIDRG